MNLSNFLIVYPLCAKVNDKDTNPNSQFQDSIMKVQSIPPIGKHAREIFILSYDRSQIWKSIKAGIVAKVKMSIVAI
jgi:hypothetical protein